MRMGKRSALVTIAAGAVAATVVGWAGVTFGVSTGGYSTSKQGCPVYPDANTFLGAYPGCHNAQILVTDHSGHTYAEVGTYQTGQDKNQNVHSGSVMVTPNGSGNAYGNPNGSPYSSPGSCPPPSSYQSPQPGQQETDQSCPPQGAPAAGPVTGPAVGATFDTHWQPIPPDQCGLESIVLLPLNYLPPPVGGGSPCTLDPTKWSLPSQAPTVTPWYRTGTPSTRASELVLSGGQIYFGGDDNLDSGEHDGVDGQYGSGNAYNGPSDGGSLSVDWQPISGAESLSSWLDAIAGVGSNSGAPLASLAPVARNPVPVANAGGGLCADGVCVQAYTNQRTIYRGGGANGQSQRDAYNYQGKKWGPYNCNSGSVSNEQACQSPSQGGTAACPSGSNATDNSCGANYYRQQEASKVTSEPGVMVFEDPDPQGSPALPPQLYPIPAAYVGTCGVVAGGGSVQAPSSPTNGTAASGLLSTNQAGQVVAADPTGC